ncbi:hypothetical protein TI05_14670 [Achromatium sp. WMS3]|nr:hypothetical protein TI05_14670 [Achromatium sp. WMS3]
MRTNNTFMAPYRIEVGRQDGVSPREIVGAIANESGLEGRHIGRINIMDAYSILDLPKNMSPEIQQHLRRVMVCGKRLDLKPTSESTNQQSFIKRPRRKHQESFVTE